jgi:hypothetical protein
MVDFTVALKEEMERGREKFPCKESDCCTSSAQQLHSLTTQEVGSTMGAFEIVI